MGLSDEERDQLRAAVRGLLDERSSSAQVRALFDDPLGYDPDLWDRMAGLGWLAMHLPEDHGGMGGSHADLAVVLQELGRHLTPSPLTASVVLGAGALVLGDNAPLRAAELPALADGSRKATLASCPPGGSCDPDRLEMRWQPLAGGGRLDGVAGFVPYARVAELVVVAALGPSGPVLVAVDLPVAGVTIDASPVYDRTRRFDVVRCDGVGVAADHVVAGPETAREVLGRLNDLGAIAAGCDGLGVAERATERTALYATQRFQFGRPIGSFQAVKHHCANMLVATEASRAAVLGAVDALDQPGADVGEAAAIVKAFAATACAEACAVSVQVHGGIGFTWEDDCHLLLKRAKLDEAWFGTPAWHRRRLAARLLA